MAVAKSFSSVILLFLLLNAQATQFSISGLSSGAFLTVQMEVAYSANVIGAGVIAGGPFYCSEGSTLASTTDCMSIPDLIDLSDLTEYTAARVKDGSIDDTSNMASHQVFLFSGTLDTVVNQGVMKKLATYLGNYVPASNIVTEFNVPAEHAFITDDFGGICAYLGIPFINNCGIDTAGIILQQIYGTLNPKVSSISKNYFSFKQSEYFSSDNWDIAIMADDGFLYVPTACQGNYSACKLHVVMHGCGENYLESFSTVIYNAGYSQWAEANDMILLFPQASMDLLLNPMGCWDWWGYTNSDFALKKGVQMAGIFAMTQSLPAASSLKAVSS
jgi:hypothetical protein